MSSHQPEGRESLLGDTASISSAGPPASSQDPTTTPQPPSESSKAPLGSKKNHDEDLPEAWTLSVGWSYFWRNVLATLFGRRWHELLLSFTMGSTALVLLCFTVFTHSLHASLRPGYPHTPGSLTTTTFESTTFTHHAPDQVFLGTALATKDNSLDTPVFITITTPRATTSLSTIVNESPQSTPDGHESPSHGARKLRVAFWIFVVAFFLLVEGNNTESLEKIVGHSRSSLYT